MSNYIINIDGGGTKTLGVLWNDESQELKRVTKGFSNFNVDVQTSKNNIELVIKELTTEIEGTINVYMGLSGVSGLKDKNSYEEQLKKKYSLNKVLIESDAYLGLYSVENKTSKPVIMVIGGTGSIAYYLNNNQVGRLGGYGHLLGDEGSGYHLVIESFKYMINDYETNEKLSPFTIKLLKRLNIDQVDNIKALVYNVSKDNVAKYSKDIGALALDNDEVAIFLLVNEGKLLASLVIKAYHKLKANGEVIVAIRGGFVLGQKIVKDTFVKVLNDSQINYIIDSSNSEPVKGALTIHQLNKTNKLGEYKIKENMVIKQ